MRSTSFTKSAGIALLSHALLAGCESRPAKPDESSAQRIVEMERASIGTYLGMVREVRTGGQSGVDQAAMAHALRSGVSVGGWVPAENTAEVFEGGVYRDQAGGIPHELLAGGNFRETTFENVAAFISSQDNYPKELLEPLLEKARNNPADPSIRTALQVATTDGTLVITTDNPKLSDGTVIMQGLAEKFTKPYFVITLSAEERVPQEQILNARLWIVRQEIESLNIGGPRASHERDFGYPIEATARAVLDELFR